MGLQELAKRIRVLRPALAKVYHAAYDEVTREEAEALLALFRELAPFLESHRGEWPLWIYDLLDELEKKIKELKKEQEEE